MRRLVILLVLAALLGVGTAYAAIRGLPGVLLGYPAAGYVRLGPGCRWVANGTSALTITRKSGQAINVVNVDAAPHLLKQVSGSPTPLPTGPLKHNEAVGFVWRSTAPQQKIVFSTCSGSVKLTVNVVG